MKEKPMLLGWIILLSTAFAFAIISPIPVAFPLLANNHAPAPVPRTGQTKSYGIRDDGALQMGIPMPYPCFTDRGDGTIKDKLTGLVWLKNSNCFGFTDWSSALSYSNSLASGNFGLTDGSTAGTWRLPNVHELPSLINFGYYNPALSIAHPFSNVQSDSVWTSYRTSTYDIGLLSHDAFLVNMFSGQITSLPKSHTLFIWPVSGLSDGVASVPRTGLTQSLMRMAAPISRDYFWVCAKTVQAK
jgi:hypothetical protein